MDQVFDASALRTDAPPLVIDATLAAPADAGPPDAAPLPDAHECPADYTEDPVSGHAYRFRRTRVTWDEAVEACEETGEDVHLVTIDDATELALIHGIVNNTVVWVGASDSAVEGLFELVTGEPATFLPWASGEPNNTGNEDCVELIAGEHFNDQGCSDEHPFVCECE